MSDSIYLQGSEDVARAGRDMSSAAESIARTQGWQQEHLDRWLLDFTEQVNRLVTVLGQSNE